MAGRNINDLRYADDTTIMAETEEELNLLMKVKAESEKFGLKLNSQKTKIMASGPITCWQNDVSDFCLFVCFLSLLFNKLFRLIITFLSRSKCFLISWLQS